MAPQNAHSVIISPTPPPPPQKKKSSFWTPLPPKFKIWTPKMARAYVYLKVSEYPPPAPCTYALFPCPLQRYWWLSFGWHHEVMSHIFDSTVESYIIRHLTDWVHSVKVERAFCPLNIRFFCCCCFLFCCFTSQVNSYGHGRTVSSPNHTFSTACTFIHASRQGFY